MGLIIFDVDGTLYDLSDVVKTNYRLQIQFYSEETGASEEEARAVFDQNGILPCKSERAKSATEFFLRSGLDGDKWRRYREAHFSPEDIDRSKAVKEEVLRAFAGLCGLVLLSSNTRRNILNTLEWIGIHSQVFQGIYCPDRNPGKEPFNKADALDGIIAKTGIGASQMLSIGDRYATDIEPLLRQGGRGVLISGPEDVQYVYEDLRDGRLGAAPGRNYRFFE